VKVDKNGGFKVKMGMKGAGKEVKINTQHVFSIFYFSGAHT
jgi:hypothetical protein